MKSHNLFSKTIKVIRSCETREQVRVARKFYELAIPHLEAAHHKQILQNMLYEKR